MTTAEKAHAYDEALEKAKEILEMTSDKSAIYTIFPELAESEDEKIRKQIKAFIKSRGSQITQSKTNAWIAWLEKQKSANWSEKDERNLQGVIDEIEANKNQAPDCDLATYDRFLSWLKSLKGRVQPKVELTQFDENIIEAAIAFVGKNNHFNCWGGVYKGTVLSALRSLRHQK